MLNYELRIMNYELRRISPQVHIRAPLADL
jgi:hypothetical protein